MSPPLTFRHLDADFVTDRILLGADLGADAGFVGRGLRELEAAGITHILDTRIEWTDAAIARRITPGITYKHAGIDDAGQQVPDAWFEEVVSWLNEVLADASHKMFVHCHMGINRSPSAVVAYFLAQGLSVREAMSRIRQARASAYGYYAEDALDWWLRKTHTPHAQRVLAREELATWRQENPQNGAVAGPALHSDEGLGDAPNLWILPLSPAECLAVAATWQSDPFATQRITLAHGSPGPKEGTAVLLWCTADDPTEAGVHGMAFPTGQVAAAQGNATERSALVEVDVVDSTLLVSLADICALGAFPRKSLHLGVLRELAPREAGLIADIWNRHATDRVVELATNAYGSD
jgi:dual specificity phosphatase 3